MPVRKFSTLNFRTNHSRDVVLHYDQPITNDKILQKNSPTISDRKQNQTDGAKFYDKAVEHYLKDGSLKKTIRIMGREVKGNSKFESINNKNLFNSVEFENHIFLYTRISKTKSALHYLPLKNDIEKIIQLIESELKN